MPPQIKQAKLREEFRRRFVFVPPPEPHETGRTLLRAYEIRGSVADLINFIRQILDQKTKSLLEEVEKMSEANRNSIDKIEEKTEQDRMTNRLNENMVFGYQTALSDIKALLTRTKGDN